MARFKRDQVVLVDRAPVGATRAVVTDPSVDRRGRIAARESLSGLRIVPLEDVCSPVEDLRPGTNAWALMQMREME